jgi:hypothetical protein
MRTHIRRSAASFATAAVAAGILLTTTQMTAQGQQAQQAQSQPDWIQAARARAAQNQIPRNKWDGKPDMNGIWQVMNNANWDLEDNGGSQSRILIDGARGATPPGLSVVEGGTIPYQPWALLRREENRRNSLTGLRGRQEEVDPEANCWFPGIPRATYLPHPFQIFQSPPNRMWMVYQFSNTRREINLGKPEEAPIESWMGWPNGRWEGDTLVIDNTAFNDLTWFDRAGNFHSDGLSVTERFTMLSANHLWYEATITDPKVLTRPYKISMPVYRRIEKQAQLLEFKCAEYVEEWWWGEFRTPGYQEKYK